MAEWDSAYVSALPDSAFACIDSGGEKDAAGKTTPRSLRHYPHHNADGRVDLPHLRNALGRVAQEDTTSCGVGHLRAHATALGIGEKGEALAVEVKSYTPHELKLEDDGSVVVAFAKLGAVDEEGDYSYPGMVPAKQVPISAYSHNIWPQRGGQMPTGLVELSERDGWAIATGRFFTETTHGRDAYLTVKAMGPLQQWSYGYNVLEKAAPPAGIKARRGLKSVDVHEISPVLLGAQPLTHTMGIKEADDLLADLELLATDLDADPPAGSTFAEMSQRLLLDVEAFNRRAEAIAAIRQKEGRAISTSRLDLLEGHIGALQSAIETLREMVDAAKPKPKPADGSHEAVAKARHAHAAAELALASRTH